MDNAVRRLSLSTAALQLALMTTACTDMLHSDAENAGRRSAQARQEALNAMKLSSAQAVAAASVSGQALVRLLAGNTHVEAYRKRSGDPKPYLTTYDYYGLDGSFVGRDTHSRRTIDYQDLGRWSVDGNVLCVIVQSIEAEENCYTVRLMANGAIQYWIYKPGDPFDGLLTRIVNIVRPGLQEPEYVSDPAAFR